MLYLYVICRPMTAAHIEVFYHCARCLFQWAVEGPKHGICEGCPGQISDGPVPEGLRDESSADDTSPVPQGPQSMRTLECVPHFMMVRSGQSMAKGIKAWLSQLPNRKHWCKVGLPIHYKLVNKPLNYGYLWLAVLQILN